jgi:hypothetical protein
LSQEKGKELGLSLYQQADTTSTLNGVEYNDAIVARKANPFMTQFSDNHIEGSSYKRHSCCIGVFRLTLAGKLW